MPASSQLVSLEHAKDWAKRLHKHGCLPSLAKAQAAVALMLGHADWHGLTQHYQKSAQPSVSPQEPKRTIDESMVVLCDEINRLYPGLGATQVIEMAREMDVLDASFDELDREVRAHQDEGHFDSDALSMALEAHQRTVQSPPNHILLRVALTDPKKDALVLVTSELYGRTLQLHDR